MLLLATTSYRASDFLDAARSLEVDVVVGSDHRPAFAELLPDAAVELDFADPDGCVERIVELHRSHPLDAIVAAEDEGAVVAAAASRALDLPHNPPEAVRLARYKDRMRAALTAAGVPSPDHRVVSIDDDPGRLAGEVRYPCVLKPVFLSASRGVIRADDRDELVRAFRRIARILADPDVAGRDPEAARRILIEDYVPGAEIALEGLLVDGRLRILALFDKPDPLEGPYFEETYYVTPARIEPSARAAVESAVADTCRALGLRHGPVHAEVRLNDRGARVIELAPRSIGGLCSRTLRFGTGLSLEELILRHAVGASIEGLARDRRAAGVLMLPIPRRGVLREVVGLKDANAVPGIEDVTISVPLGQEVVPLPEGHRYLGFIFARSDTPDQVERALREAWRRLRPVIEPEPS